MRVKAVIAYDGSSYLGFQKQKSTQSTITYQIEKALKSLHIDSQIVGSGRTDAGVHATGQVIHFDLPEYWRDMQKLKTNINRKLTDIYVKHITSVDTDFHARFSAKRRTYRYVFKTSRPSIFEQKYIAYYEVFNTTLLDSMLKNFIGKHDFDFFRKTGTDTHTSNREIYIAKHIQRGNYHYIYFQANGFLRSQVRMMIDMAIQSVRDNLDNTLLLEQLQCTHKHHTRLAPPEGLYLSTIRY